MIKEKKNDLGTNMIWRFAEKWGCQAANFVVTIVIARILDPEAYGVVAIVNAFIQIFTIFIDAGLGTSLIQKKDSDELDFSTVFYTNLLLCISIYVIIFFISPYIANYYEINELSTLLRVSSITIIIYALENVQEAYISKNLMFKKFFYSSLAGTIGGGILGIIMALKGFGAWALIAAHIFDVAVDTLVMMFTISFRPKLQFSFERLKPLFNYSSKILLSRFSNRFFNKIYHLIIGKCYTSEDLAYYDKGNSFTTKIVENTDASIRTVLFPALSKKQNDKEELKRLASKTLKVNTYIMYPLLIGMLAVSKQMVEVLLTSKWLEVVPYIQLFCLINLFLPLQTINVNIIKAIGKSDLILKQEIIKKVIAVIILIITLKHGVLIILVGKLIINFMYFIVDGYPNNKNINYGPIRQIIDIIPNLFISIIMGIVVYFVGYLNLNALLLLIIQIIYGGIVYIFLSVIIKNQSFYYLIGFVKTKLKKENN